MFELNWICEVCFLESFQPFYLLARLTFSFKLKLLSMMMMNLFMLVFKWIRFQLEIKQEAVWSKFSIWKMYHNFSICHLASNIKYNLHIYKIYFLQQRGKTRFFLSDFWLALFGHVTSWSCVASLLAWSGRHESSVQTCRRPLVVFWWWAPVWRAACPPACFGGSSRTKMSTLSFGTKPAESVSRRTQGSRRPPCRLCHSFHNS